MTASHLPGGSFRTGTAPRRARVSPRVALRACLVAVALALLVVVLAGCGNAELPRAAPVAPTPPPTTSATPAPTTTAPPTTTTAPTTEPTTGSATPSTEGRAPAPRTAAPGPAPRAGGGSGGSGGSGGGGGTGGSAGGGATGARGTPIWPASDAGSAARLQKQVDGGGDPWLLDPTEVATSYSGVELKYRNPTIVPTRAGVVEVQDGATPRMATITLAQTVRQGDGGIWLVTGVRPR
ncbi:hypothetical protein [Pseudonocardia sp. KRD291]|uniref:hypothetical protein n=1 Tax=Pseudonocardia sp. KRD291 TaxID=2792007 RepID=UPI001C4A54E8|nr:hypothetical protein [Pseudonocardia sp. KRD291]MBW0105349.1 hypothetical protein [Pseudonocardia sp. KRD291]